MHSGFDDHPDPRCEVKIWADRLAFMADLDGVALRAVGEHMTSEAFQRACALAWNKAQFKVAAVVTSNTQPGDPQPDDEKDEKKKMVS